MTQEASPLPSSPNFADEPHALATAGSGPRAFHPEGLGASPAGPARRPWLVWLVVGNATLLLAMLVGVIVLVLSWSGPRDVAGYAPQHAGPMPLARLPMDPNDSSPTDEPVRALRPADLPEREPVSPALHRLDPELLQALIRAGDVVDAAPMNPDGSIPRAEAGSPRSVVKADPSALPRVMQPNRAELPMVTPSTPSEVLTMDEPVRGSASRVDSAPSFTAAKPSAGQGSAVVPDYRATRRDLSAVAEALLKLNQRVESARATTAQGFSKETESRGP